MPTDQPVETSFAKAKIANQSSTHKVLLSYFNAIKGTAVAQWLRCCDTNRKVAVSIPDGVIGIFH